MRLTLRTLLAYLDDRLAPANARELGVKVSQSPFAKELANRIREVVRRRRLANESPAPKTIDANLIAEYLDDQLTPELVALIEKEILSSDHSLAEVAASHQIIGMLNDPVEISNQLKERLYKLDPAAKQIVNGAARTTVAASGPVEWKPLTAQAVSQKRSPMILLLVMVFGWLILLATDSNLFRSKPDTTAAFTATAPVIPPPAEITDVVQQPENVAPKPAVPAPPLKSLIEAAENAVAAPIGSPPATSMKAGDSQVATTTSPATAAPENVAANETAVTQVPAVMQEERAKPATVASVTDTAAAAVSPKEMSTTEIVPAPTETPAVPVKPAEVFEVQDLNAMLLYADATMQQWQWASSLGVAPGSNWHTQLTTGFAGIAEPFAAVIVAPRAGWRARMLGSAVFRAVDRVDSGIELLEGRMILSRGNVNEPQPFLLQAGGRVLKIELPTTTQRIGLLVVPQASATDELEESTEEDNALALLPITNSCTVFVFAANEDVVVHVDENPAAITMKAGSTLVWKTNSDEMPEPGVASIATIPEWIFESDTAKTEAMQKLMAATADEFHKYPSVKEGTLAVAANRNPELAAYAARLPALTRNVSDLVSFLIQSEEESVQRESIIGLKRIVMQSPLGRSRVEQAMGNRLSEMEVEVAMKMLTGITATAAEDRDTSGWLVEMLSSNRLALRALAIFTLEELTNERHGYFAHDDGGRRDASVRRWKRLLDRNDGCLIKPPE